MISENRPKGKGYQIWKRGTWRLCRAVEGLGQWEFAMYNIA